MWFLSVVTRKAFQNKFKIYMRHFKIYKTMTRTLTNLEFVFRLLCQHILGCMHRDCVVNLPQSCWIMHYLATNVCIVCNHCCTYCCSHQSILSVSHSISCMHVKQHCIGYKINCQLSIDVILMSHKINLFSCIPEIDESPNEQVFV